MAKTLVLPAARGWPKNAQMATAISTRYNIAMSNPYSAILLVGSKGMLAQAVARALQRRGLPFSAADLPEYDITREADVQKLFEQHRPTLLLNCAAHTKVDLCEQEEQKVTAINGHAVGTLAGACKQHGTRLLHI